MAGSALLHPEKILLAADVRPGMHVADFGVGRTGHLIFPAAKLVGEQGRVYGVDLVRDALRMLEGRRRQYLVHNLDLIHGDIEQGNLDIPERSLDRIFLVHTLPLVREPRGLVSEIRRLLKDEGRVVVIDWDPATAHPVAPQSEFRIHPNQVDLAFARGGCDACGYFEPSDWHWGRVYRLV